MVLYHHHDTLSSGVRSAIIYNTFFFEDIVTQRYLFEIRFLFIYLFIFFPLRLKTISWHLVGTEKGGITTKQQYSIHHLGETFLARQAIRLSVQTFIYVDWPIVNDAVIDVSLSNTRQSVVSSPGLTPFGNIEKVYCTCAVCVCVCVAGRDQLIWRRRDCIQSEE